MSEISDALAAWRNPHAGDACSSTRAFQGAVTSSVHPFVLSAPENLGSPQACRLCGFWVATSRLPPQPRLLPARNPNTAFVSPHLCVNVGRVVLGITAGAQPRPTPSRSAAPCHVGRGRLGHGPLGNFDMSTPNKNRGSWGYAAGHPLGDITSNLNRETFGPRRQDRRAVSGVCGMLVHVTSDARMRAMDLLYAFFRYETNRLAALPEFGLLRWDGQAYVPRDWTAFTGLPDERPATPIDTWAYNVLMNDPTAMLDWNTDYNILAATVDDPLKPPHHVNVGSSFRVLDHKQMFFEALMMCHRGAPRVPVETGVGRSAPGWRAPWIRPLERYYQRIWVPGACVNPSWPANQQFPDPAPTVLMEGRAGADGQMRPEWTDPLPVAEQKFPFLPSKEVYRPMSVEMATDARNDYAANFESWMYRCFFALLKDSADTTHIPLAQRIRMAERLTLGNKPRAVRGKQFAFACPVMWRFYFGGVTVNADGPGFPNVRRRIAGWFLRFRYYLTFVLEGTTVVPWDSTVEPTVETLKDWRTAGDWSYVIRKFPEVASKLRTLVNFMSYIVPVEYESAEHPEWVKPKAPLRLLNLSAKREPYEVIFDGKISARLLVHLNRNDLQDDDPNNPILPVGFLSPLVPRYVDRHATRTQFSDSEIFNAGNAAQRKMMENRLLDLLFSAKRSRAVRMEVRDEPQFTLQQCIRKPMVMTYNKGNEARGGRPIPVTFWRFSTDSKHSRIMIFLRTKNVLRKTDPHYRRRFAHSIAEFYKKRRKPLYPWPTPPAQATEGQMINFYSCPGTPAATWVLGLNCKILGNDFGERNSIQEVDMDLFYRQQPAPVDPTNLVAVKNAKRQRDSFIRTLKGRFMYHLTGQARFNHLENKVARAAHDPPPGQLPVSQAIEMLKGLKRQFLQQPDPREMFFYQTIKYRVQASIRDFFYSKLHMQRVYELKVDKGRAAQLTALWKRGVMYPNTYRAARDNVGEPRELDEPELFHLRTVPKMRRQKYRLVSQQFDPTKRGAADTRDPEYRRPISPFRAALHVFDLPRWMWNGPVAQTGQFSIVRWMACQGATVGFVPDQRTSDACLLDNIRTGGHGHRLVATTVSKTKCPRDHVWKRRRVKGHHRHRNFCLTSNRWASECPDRDVDHNHKTHRLKRCDRPAGAGHEHLVDPPAGHAGNMRRFFFERDTIGGGNTGYRAIFHCFNRGAIPHFQLTPGARRWGIGPAPPGAWPGDPQPFPHQLAGGNDSDPDDDDDDAEGIG